MKSIIEESKQKVLHSPVVKYVSKEKIEQAFLKIYIYNTEEELYNKYFENTGKKYDGELKGLNCYEGNFFGPNVTTHTIIHEVLHELSSEFDKDGHKIENGIMGDEGNFAIQVNEGLTDYLAAKISGEDSKCYREGHIFFSAVEPSINQYYADEEIFYIIGI